MSAALEAAAVVADDVRSLEETARFFSVSVPTVRRWIADGCPVVERGGNGVAYKLSLAALAAWRADLKRADAAAEDAKRATDQQLALTLLGEGAVSNAGADGLSKTQRAELIASEYQYAKLAEMRRDLIRFDDARSIVARAAAMVSAGVRAIPDGLAAEFGWGEDVTQECLARVEAVLTDLADELAKLTGPASAGGGA